ncbi:MAG: Rieske 2Fe-2S domain-containing protein [Actinomycetota bacterium]
MTTKTAASRRNTKNPPQRPDTSRGARHTRRERSLAEGWTDMPSSIRILRAFLGATFLFAGAQKLFDPNFLHTGSATFIGTQLHGFARGTPAGPLLSILNRAPVLAGIGIALLEIAIGVATLLGVAPLTAALGGIVVSATLWLSATWHVHPYFLGSDSVYAVAWIALLASLWQMDRARNGGVRGPLEVLDTMDRRQFLRGGVVAGLSIGVAAASKALAGPITSTAVGGTQAQGRPAGATGNPSGSTGASGSTGSGHSPSVGGRTITTLDRLPVGKAIGFTAPGVGAAVLVRLATDNVVAYSRICTHAGCLVGYDSSNRILFCPCHGAEFDPARGAMPIAGPAPTALQMIPVVVDPRSRKVILPAQ